MPDMTSLLLMMECKMINLIWYTKGEIMATILVAICIITIGIVTKSVFKDRNNKRKEK